MKNPYFDHCDSDNISVSVLLVPFWCIVSLESVKQTHQIPVDLHFVRVLKWVNWNSNFIQTSFHIPLLHFSFFTLVPIILDKNNAKRIIYLTHARDVARILQTSKMENFTAILYGFWSLTTIAKLSILDVCRGAS